MQLYDYYLSSAAYRVRIALNLKGLPYEAVNINLREGMQRSSDYLDLNPQGLIPAIEEGGKILSQSMAILEYLEETYPQTPLLPSDPWHRAEARRLCYMVACDIHPLNNLRVMHYLKEKMGHTQEEVMVWYHHWIDAGFDAFETSLTGENYCYGGRVSLADVMLMPQVYNARRFNVDMSPYPKICRIEEQLLHKEAFQKAYPAS